MAAFQYVRNIPAEVWRSTEWVEYELPRRFGIVTSNTSESINSMLLDSRELGWATALCSIVDKMINRISDCRGKYYTKDDNEIVPYVKQLLTKRYAMAASYVVKEVDDRGRINLSIKRADAEFIKEPGK